jgi:hypothetical protein
MLGSSRIRPAPKPPGIDVDRRRDHPVDLARYRVTAARIGSGPGAMQGCYLGGFGLDLVPAASAPHDQPQLGFSPSTPQRHRPAGSDFVGRVFSLVASTLNNGCAASRENRSRGILVTSGAATSLNPASWANRVWVTRVEPRLDRNYPYHGQRDQLGTRPGHP